MPRQRHLFRRGSVWTWRRRICGLLTGTSHVQVSLRTTSLVIARVLASRLTYESDRMYDALASGDLSPAECKAWLESVVRAELAAITQTRTIARLDPAAIPETDRHADWAQAQAWRLIAERGLGASVAPADAETLRCAGASAEAMATLERLHARTVSEILAPTGVATMVAAARAALAPTHPDKAPLLDAPSYMTILQLRKFLIAGRAAAWDAADQMTDPTQNWANDFARSLVASQQLPECFASASAEAAAVTSLPLSEVVSTPVASPVFPIAGPPPGKFTFDPDLLALVGRINSEPDRAHIKEDSRRQLIAGVKLFIRATGITKITDVEQQHLKYFKGVLQRLPRHYGKSPKDADRSIDEILARADDLPEDEVGLAPRTINGHLDRFDLLLRTAKSENLKVSDSIELGLLRVPETKRDRDKREPFTVDDIRKVFRHTVWTGCHRADRRHLPGKLVMQDGLYWGPLMAAYGGARREEILGLAPEDFCEIDGIPCYHIRDNAHRTVKTLSSERLVPIHPHLIELGLLNHVTERRKARETAIFPELKPTNDTETFGDKIFYNWDRALDIQLEGNPKGLCFHSLRHYVIGFLKGDKTVSEKERRDLVGHVGTDAHDENYDTPTRMREMLQIVMRLPRVF